MAHASGKRLKENVLWEFFTRARKQFFPHEAIWLFFSRRLSSLSLILRQRVMTRKNIERETADWTDRETIFMWHFFIYFRRWHLSCRDIPEDVLNTYCWIHSTYTVVDAFMKKQGQEVPFPGVDNSQSRGQLTIKHTKYYQWVAFTLFFQVSTERSFTSFSSFSQGKFSSCKWRNVQLKFNHFLFVGRQRNT